jgi:hypothetical protein
LVARLLREPDGLLGLVGLFGIVPEQETARAAPKQLAKEWTALFQVPADGYWAGHSDFGAALSGTAEEVALVGESRAADMVVNILMPLLVAYADVHNRAGLRSAVEEVYAVYPKLADNRVTRAMADEVFGPRKRSAINGARRQQGLMHLYRLYCEARRCHECPVSGLRG